jgi:hypothetical protein
MALTKVSAGVLNIDDLYGFRNRVINGDMRIDQRNNGASVNSSSGGTFAVDRFASFASGGGVYTTQQSSDVPTGQGFTNSIVSTVTTTDAPTGSDYYLIVQSIEGFNVADLGWGTANAQAVTVSFWVKSSLTGTYTVAFRNSALNRSYRATYTITSANAWEKKSITIPGDTTGTWLTNNSVGIQLGFTLGAGTNFIDAGNVWSALEDFAATGQTQWIGTSGATFYLTGVQLEVGSTATPFERRPYGLELDLCQRYFYAIRSTNVSNGDSTGINGVVGGSTAAHRTQAPHPVTMRSNTISLTFSNVSSAGTDLRLYDGSSAPNITSVGTSFSNSQAIQFDSTASAGGLTTGRAVTVLWQSNILNGYIWVSAEL